ncbi:hypothetical protein IWZ03DRAFT_392458 [Phyllosticta citriasiana]|uniref:C2H2-type domain-containing protein n=1 Tax=Phyllosticta citriasiana TaxID=595635 RepID=A0ABR1KW02_9PEZI
MASNQVHPRRRPQKDESVQVPSPLMTSHLRKAGTFHSPTNVSSELVDPINFCSMPKRSETNPQSLEQLIDAGQSRVAGLLAEFDNVLSGKTAPDASILKDEQVLPVPSFMLGNHAVADPDAMQIDSKPAAVDHHHVSDSGLGSSVSGSAHGARRARSTHSAATSRSAVTQSYSGLSGSATKVRALSKQAFGVIQTRIIRPILREPSLREFHPLIQDVPSRIGSKDITNLRDLEKTLIFLAPVSLNCSDLSVSVAHICRQLKQYAASPAKYKQFCETSVAFIADTVSHICDADQRLPTDRPYTTNYFLDLVEQIRRYAAIMAATRVKKASDEAAREMDYSPDEKVVLHGGISKNGQPAQLVREKNGKVIPLPSESEQAASLAHLKRPLDADMEEEDDDVYRSMARRRKSDRPGDVKHICSECRKTFDRPCDLTKHEKTHSRPWKCPELKCKYHNVGWPTEKERDRHVNDKHTATPAQYKCLFHPCAYSSKRESNCKQHMEKAHGWTYVRSKANGKGPKKSTGSVSSLAPRTPLTPFVDTPPTGHIQQLSTPMLSTPATPFDNSPSVSSFPEVDFDSNASSSGFDTASMFFGNQGQEMYRRESNTTAGTHLTFSTGCSPMPQSTFEDAITTPNTDFNHSAADMLYDQTFNFNTNMQQPTPALSSDDLFADHFPPLDMSKTFNFANMGTNQLSPHAQPNMTLFPSANNNLHLDEGFGGDDFLPSGDFQLFGDSSMTLAPTSAPSNPAPAPVVNNNGEGSSNWFQDLSNFGGQFDNMMYNPNQAWNELEFDFGSQ